MFVEFLTAEVFDFLVIGNIVIGLFLAGRRFRIDLRRPLPDEAPAWARSAYDSSTTAHSPDS